MSDAKLAAQAREKGRQARRAGKPVGACPYRGFTPLVRQMAEQFRLGWYEADMSRKAGLS